MSEEFPSPFNGGVRVQITNPIPIWMRHQASQKQLESSSESSDDEQKIPINTQQNNNKFWQKHYDMIKLKSKEVTEKRKKDK